MVDEVKKDGAVDVEPKVDAPADNVTPITDAAEPQMPQVPQNAMLSIQDLQNIRAFMDRVEMKGAQEAKIMTLICSKIETILKVEAEAAQIAQDKAAAENGAPK